MVKTHKTIDDHFVPIQAGIEVLSWSKRIMNEVMCLAEDLGIDIYYEDTDSMHLPEEDEACTRGGPACNILTRICHFAPGVP